MISTQPIANPNRTPTHEFIGEWRGAGALQGLPRWMLIANEDGTPTSKFIGLARIAFNLTPSISLTARDPIISVEADTYGNPTTDMLTAWTTWTS